MALNLTSMYVYVGTACGSQLKHYYWRLDYNYILKTARFNYICRDRSTCNISNLSFLIIGTRGLRISYLPLLQIYMWLLFGTESISGKYSPGQVRAT